MPNVFVTILRCAGSWRRRSVACHNLGPRIIANNTLEGIEGIAEIVSLH
jgi:hypothetical protein